MPTVEDVISEANRIPAEDALVTGSQRLFLIKTGLGP